MPTLVELVGTYLDAGTDPAHPGTVSITPDVLSANGTAVIVQQPVTATVEGDGTFAVEVVASNDPAWALAGESMPYIITENVPGNHRAYMAYIDGPGPVDITDLVPLAEAPDLSPAAWPSFDYAKVIDVLDIPDTWTEVNRLSVDVVPGVYMFGVSLTWAFDVTNRSAMFRFSDDGGQSWGHEYTIEPSDAQDRVPFLYQYPIKYTAAQNASAIMQARKENAQGTLDVTFCDLYLQRVE